MKSRSKRNDPRWSEFYELTGVWWSFSIVPLSYRDMLYAVAYGDAEVRHATDLCFMWIKDPKDRSHVYFDESTERFPAPRVRYVRAMEEK